MYSTKDGFANRFERISADRIGFNNVVPKAGHVIYINNDDKVVLANDSSSTEAAMSGVIVAVTLNATGGGVKEIVVAPCGEEVPLKIFGTLAELKALGNSSTAYVSDAAGAIKGTEPLTGMFSRKVFRLLKRFASLTEQDYQERYVEIIEDKPTQV